MFRTFFAALSALTIICAPAGAQNNSLGDQSTSPVVTTFSMNRTAQIYQSQGLTTEILTSPSGVRLLGVTVPSGARFLVQPRDCQDTANLAGCQFVEFTAQFQSNSVPYEAINEFHYKQSRSSYATRLPSFTILSNRAYAVAGVREEHILLKTAVFMIDATNFAQVVASTDLGQTVSTDDRDFPELLNYAKEQNVQDYDFPDAYQLEYFSTSGASFMAENFKKFIPGTSDTQ